MRDGFRFVVESSLTKGFCTDLRREDSITKVMHSIRDKLNRREKKRQKIEGVEEEAEDGDEEGTTAARDETEDRDGGETCS